MKWRRPYSGGWVRYASGSLLVLGSMFFLAAAVSVAGTSEPVGHKAVALVAIVAFAAAYSVFLWRVFRFGIYTSDEGLRVREFARTMTFRWSEVRDIRLAPLTRPKWFWAQVPGRLETIWIDRNGAPPVQTLINKGSAEFLGRRSAFERTFQRLRSEWERRRAHPTV